MDLEIIALHPAGITSDSYAGLVYWDADTWMFPSLLALFPSFAQSITNFRSRHLDAALETPRFTLAQAHCIPGPAVDSGTVLVWAHATTTRYLPPLTAPSEGTES